MFGPILVGERVRLEPPRPEYASSFQHWVADLEVTRYLRRRNPPTLCEAEALLEQTAEDPQIVLWAIALKDTGKVIGGTVLEKIDWRISRDAESGIMIGDKSAWRQGYAIEVMRLRTEYAFSDLGLRKIWTGVDMPNEGSRRALEKVGYRQCGLMRRHHFTNGQWVDVWLAEIFREDWEQARAGTCTDR